MWVVIARVIQAERDIEIRMAVANKPIDIDKFRELFEYDSKTGVLSNRINRGSRARQGAVAGSRHNDGYLTVRVEGSNYLVHRICWALANNRDPAELTIDHKNTNRTDNRECNLRLASKQQQLGNQKTKRSIYLRDNQYCFCVLDIKTNERHHCAYDTLEEAMIGKQMLLEELRSR